MNIIIVNPIRCNGESNASIQAIIAIGGTPPYSYSVNGGFSHTDMSYFINYGAGTYSIEVQDANNCFYSNTISINNQNSQSATSPFTFLISNYNGYEISCHMINDGSIELIGLLIPLDSISWVGPQNFSSNNQN